MQKSFHVYLGSTYRDLLSERNAVLESLGELSAQFPALTFFCPRSIQPMEACKEEIRHSDLLILIVGHLQGVMVPGLGITYGEAEYLEAVAQGKRILVYFRDEQMDRNPGRFERDPVRANQLKAFKEKLQVQLTPKLFTDLPSLVNAILADLNPLIQDRGLENTTTPLRSRYKSEGSITRKSPFIAGPIAPEPAAESQTRTIPLLQKALATPYRKRKAGFIIRSKGVALALVLLPVVGILLLKFHDLPFIKASFSLALPKGNSAQLTHSNSGAEVPDTEPNELTTATAVESANFLDTGSIPAVAPQPIPTPTATVVLMDDTDTLKTLIRHAMDGSPDEQLQVAQRYEFGQGLEQNDSLAFRWYRKAAERGLAEAQYQLAAMYRIGKGTRRSSYQAVRWYQAAADQGHPKAQVKLGRMYQNGKGVLQNETLAFKWFLKAADQNDPDAEKILAELKEN